MQICRKAIKCINKASSNFIMLSLYGDKDKNFF